MSDYRINDLHIQAHIHGLSSRSVLDLDDSPTVLGDEEVAGSNPVTPTSRIPDQTHIQFWSPQAASTAAKYSNTSLQDLAKPPQRLARGCRARIRVDLHCDCMISMPEDSQSPC
jgi:hypothetical protein